MKLKNSYFYTLRENVKDEDSTSSNLLVRAGMIKKSSAGVYMFLPLGLKVLQNIETIIREEMTAIGCQEVLMPSLISEEVYIASGRRSAFGKGMFSLQDRFGKPFVLGPTHEELFSVAAQAGVQSYKDLPFSLYQIQNKFRDEPRPRFGLIRVREFIMKDAYSFDIDETGLNLSYNNQFQAYKNIFDRLEIDYKIVRADTGVMGGLLSEEFQAVSDIGEDTLVLCDTCDFASNLEIAQCTPSSLHEEVKKEKETVSTPNVKKIEDVAVFLSQPIEKLVKTLVYVADEKIYAVLVRGDHEVNEVKVQKLLGASEIRLATEEEVLLTTSSPIGFVGPLNIQCDIIADNDVCTLRNFTTGANQKDTHIVNVNSDDFTPLIVGDVRKIKVGDTCPKCGGTIHFKQGIEIGNTFKLGTKYSEIMNLTFLNADNKNLPVWMGSYGIGLARSMAAIAEQQADDYGIAWPIHIAPFKVAIVAISDKDEIQMTLANSLYDLFSQSGISCILDDRNERPGIKFKDMDLIGVPFRITVGRGAADGIIEFKARNEESYQEITVQECLNFIQNKLNK
ncbi:MAG: proline--tRNA ligase [Anaerorhabdus sp.]